MLSASPALGDILLLIGLSASAFAAGAALAIALLSRRSGNADRATAAAAPDASAEADARRKAIAELLDKLPEAVVQCDPSGRILMANAAYQDLLGIRRSGGDAALTVADVFERRQAELLPDGSRRVDEAIRTASGIRWFSWVERDLAGPDDTVSVLRSGREITDRVESEKALEEARAKAEAASEAKSRFLATVSHEFRTPLNGILGMSDLLLDTKLEPEQLAYVQALRGSAEAFLSLIEEILDFSKIEAGRIDLVCEPFELESVVQGVVELLAPRAQDKGTEIASFVSQDVPPMVRSDRDRLRQILFNLAGNAVKFTEKGGVCISVASGGGGEIVFAVEDTGAGIAPDRLETIFDEFDQGGLKAARGVGTGLGLAITRRIVQRMGGRVEVESTLGRGSAFRVRLPIEPAEGAGPRGEPLDLRVLLVGASPFEPRCLERRLGEAGAETARAPDAASAGEIMRAARFDVLIADAALGESEVRVLARAAKDSGVARTIVLLSPFERRDFGSPHAAGYDAFLIKPVRARSLFERLRPEAADTLSRPGTEDRQHAPALAGTGPVRVLLAEDNEVNALLAMKVLQKLGAFVDWAKDGPEALARAEKTLSGEGSPYDVILMDMRMPGMDGAEVTRRIREQEAATGRDERLRIVALTASMVGERERYSETAGFDGFLPKPFTVEALAAELRPGRRGIAA